MVALVKALQRQRKTDKEGI